MQFAQAPNLRLQNNNTESMLGATNQAKVIPRCMFAQQMQTLQALLR
jgi:hypothetical protein